MGMGIPWECVHFLCHYLPTRYSHYKALELHAHFFLFAQDFQTQWKWEKIGNHF